VTASPATPVLEGLRAAPGGFGQPTFAAFYDALIESARQRAVSGEPPPVLLVMGEPLAGKSTSLSQLFVRLTGGMRGEGRGASVRPYLVRWGDTIRAGKKLGVVAPERQFGDLTPDEFAGTSALLAQAAAAAQQTARGNGPALVVVEAPGVTMLTDESGQTRGLDRGYSLARDLARQEHGFIIVLCADQQVRDTHLGSREARLASGGPDVREATQLAANRIRQQVTDLLYDLAVAGKLDLPDRTPGEPVTRASLDDNPIYRNEAVLRAYLPYLLKHDLKIAAERAFIGLNGFLGSDVRPDAALLDAYDWTHRHFGL
jgi:hypothetical protein